METIGFYRSTRCGCTRKKWFAGDFERAMPIGFPGAWV